MTSFNLYYKSYEDWPEIMITPRRIDGRQACTRFEVLMLGRQPSDSSECLVEYLEIVRILFDADSTDFSAVKTFILKIQPLDIV